MWIDTNNCEHSMHTFTRDYDDPSGWKVTHGDDSECEQIEYDLSEVTDV